MTDTKKLTVQTVPDLEHPLRSFEQPILYLEEPVGSGKTGLVVSKIASTPTESHIFVAPTKELGREVKERLEKANVQNVHHLFSQGGMESVAKRTKNLINGRAPKESQVLILTGKNFRTILEDLSPILASNYHVYLDEGMDAVEFAELKAENIGQYTSLLTTNEEGLLLPALGEKDVLRNVATRPDLVSKEGKDNLLTKPFIQIAALVTCGLYDVRATITDRTIRAVALLKPEKFQNFRSVTMVSALWSQSILAMVWEQRYGVTIKPLPHDYALFDTHRAKGPGMEIFYCLHPDDNASSENLKRDAVTGLKGGNVPIERQVITEIASAVGKFFDQRGLDYCWSANDRYKDRAGALNAKRMPVVSAGLNTWQELDNVAALACMNPPRGSKGFCWAFWG